MTSPDRVAETTRWIEHAREDIGAAERMLQSRILIPRHACFLAQQCAEKALKAGLISMGIPFPTINDLDRLVFMFPSDWQLRPNRLVLATLTQWTIESLCPTDMAAATLAEAAKAVAEAKLVLEAVERELARHGYGPPAGAI